MRPAAALVLVTLGLVPLSLAACAPQAGKAINKDQLDDAVGAAIGDPNTCVVLASRSGKTVVYEFGNYLTCTHPWPDCAGGKRTARDFLNQTIGKAEATRESCASLEDGSRGVAWSAGPTPDPDLAYAAAMEGPNVPPGVVIADKLKAAFEKAGL
ncbi:hypothetical protein [Phenylobacterium conjunctum]|uniref:Lipoprotein n=1 Tax=Phenylobacterium conjunctum TaxID=1298959 RepID=A0ABW3T030_9CAUL